MSRIYLVKTPAGERLVEAGTKGQAINHCVSTDYSAEPISASDLHAYLQAGASVEKVTTKEAKGKKPGVEGSSPAVGFGVSGAVGSLSAHTAGAASWQADSTTLAASTAPQAALQAPPSLGGATAPILPSEANSRPGWNPPQPGVSVNPILAEQQRINPEAAAAAGVASPAAILPIAPRPAAAPAPAGWSDRDARGELVGGGIQRRND